MTSLDEAQIVYDLESQDLEILMSSLDENGFEIVSTEEKNPDDEIYENLKKQTEAMFLDDDEDKKQVANSLFGGLFVREAREARTRTKMETMEIIRMTMVARSEARTKNRDQKVSKVSQALSTRLRKIQRSKASRMLAIIDKEVCL